MDEQLKEATAAVEKAKKMLLDSGVDKEAVMAGGKALEKAIDEGSEKAFKEFVMASKYYAFVMKRRDMKYVTSALQAAKPMSLKNITDFDSQEFLLNAPDATYDLQDGSSKEHEAEDLITKMTAVSPSEDGMDLWKKALDSFFCGDKELIDYVQQIVGLSAIGKVHVEALVIAYGEYNVIAGHGRIMAVKEEGITEVPCVFVDYLTEAQKKAYILSDNRMAMDAGWDEELLRIEIESLKDMDFNVGLTGFSEDELAELYGEDKQSEVEDDDYDLSDALEKVAFVKRGDIWTVGRHRLMCGDVTSFEDVAQLMDGKKANLIVTDPLYNVAFESSDGLSIKNDKMANDKFYNFLLSAFKNMAEYLEKGGSAYVFHADTEGLNFRKAFVDVGFHLSGCCIWVKNSLVLGRSDYQWQHEPVLYGFLQNGKGHEL